MPKFIGYNDRWPESFKTSYYYDQVEIYGRTEKGMQGYFYQYRNRRKSVLDFIKKNVPEGGKILDVAAAQGNFTLDLAESGYDVTWNDLREELAEYVKLKYEKGSISYKAGNIFNLEFPDKFDAVLITEVIEHVAHPDRFLKKISEMLKPDGYIIMSTPNGAYFLNTLPKFTSHKDPSVFESEQFKPNADGHIFLIYPEELLWFCEKAGVEIYMQQLYSNCLTNGHLKSNFLLRILPERWVEKIESISRKLPFGISKKIHSGMTVVFRKRRG